MKRLFAAALAVLMLAQPALAQHGDEGDIAYRRALSYRDGGNLGLAAHWLEVAAGRGMPEAMFLLATMLLEGEGVPKDEVAARRWLVMASEQDYP